MKIKRLESETELAVQFRGQQPAKVILAYYPADDGEAYCLARLPWCGEPIAVRNGVCLEWSLPLMKGSTANALMEGLRPQLDRISAGYDLSWDGANVVGTYTEDAMRAMAEIDAIVAGLEGDMDIWPPEDDPSTAEDYGVSAETTDEEIAEIAKNLQTWEDNGVMYYVPRLAAYLTDLRDKLDE